MKIRKSRWGKIKIQKYWVDFFKKNNEKWILTHTQIDEAEVFYTANKKSILVLCNKYPTGYEPNYKYIYFCCTDEKHRRKGYNRLLINHIQKLDYVDKILLDSKEELIEYYKQYEFVFIHTIKNGGWDSYSHYMKWCKNRPKPYL